LALVEDESIFQTSSHRDRLLLVPDTLAAFATLGYHWRTMHRVPLLAVTGSMGKTGTKELCATMLATVGRGTASQKSFNNNIGVPYTLCQTSADDQWIVLEMGMNHAGELGELSRLGEPDVALITCIAPTHIEFFRSLSDVADAKFEICAGLRP